VTARRTLEAISTTLSLLSSGTSSVLLMNVSSKRTSCSQTCRDAHTEAAAGVRVSYKAVAGGAPTGPGTLMRSLKAALVWLIMAE